MKDDILSMYGSDSMQKEAGRATNGGQMMPKELPYSPPKGPSGMMEKGPGIHGTNHGNNVCQGKH